MKNIDLLAMIEFAKLRIDKPEEYKMIISSMKDVIKDITKLELEIIEEIDTEIKENKKKERYDVESKVAEKMRRDKPRT